MAYEIDININGDLDQVDAPAENGGTEGKPKKEQDASKGVKALGSYIVGQTITPIISGVKTQLSQNVGLITGSQGLQERINFGMKMLETGSSLYTSYGAGASIAVSMGGSAVSGGIIGIVLAIANLGIQIGFKQSNIDLSSSLENMQINHITSRMGAGFNKSRTSGRE